MAVKRLLKKFARFVLSSDNPKVSINVVTIQPNEELKGKNIVITGGNRGIGYAIAKKCLDEGGNVIIVGRNEENLKTASKKLGKNCNYVVHDIENIEKIEELFTKCNKIFSGTINCLVNNAGISLHDNNFQNVTFESFEKQVNVNLKGTYFLTQKFIEMKLKETKTEANIICISSETGSEACDIPYGLTKCAINSFVQSIAKRVYKNGIRINAISPAVTKTEMTKDFAITNEDDYSYNNAVGRVILPEEIAEIVCFFLSDKSKVITGEIIHCDASNHVKTSWEE